MTNTGILSHPGVRQYHQFSKLKLIQHKWYLLSQIRILLVCSFLVLVLFLCHLSICGI
jgi:hypothetical protein